MARNGQSFQKRIPCITFSARMIRSRNWHVAPWQHVAPSGTIIYRKSEVGQVSKPKWDRFLKYSLCVFVYILQLLSGNSKCECLLTLLYFLLYTLNTYTHTLAEHKRHTPLTAAVWLPISHTSNKILYNAQSRCLCLSNLLTWSCPYPVQCAKINNLLSTWFLYISLAPSALSPYGSFFYVSDLFKYSGNAGNNF